MELLIPFPCVGTIAATVFLALLFLFFRLSQTASRAAANTVEKVWHLKATSVSQEYCWEMRAAKSEQDVVDTVADSLRDVGGEVVRQETDQAVVYFGSRANAKSYGLWQLPPLETPTRVIFQTYRIMPDDRIYLQLRMDEDYGFHVFLGSIRRKFCQKYLDVFQSIAQAFHASVKQLDPVDAQMKFP